MALAIFGTAAADAFNDGVSAYQRGDYATAIRLFRALADQGNVLAQIGLGDIYRHGQGVPQDDALAASWYRKAAEQGNAAAQTELGVFYLGMHDEHADVQAIQWFRKAADQGNAKAQAELGELYFEGHGVPQDYAQSATWYRKAVAQVITSSVKPSSEKEGGRKSSEEQHITSVPNCSDDDYVKFWRQAAVSDVFVGLVDDPTTQKPYAKAPEFTLTPTTLLRGDNFLRCKYIISGDKIMTGFGEQNINAVFMTQTVYSDDGKPSNRYWSNGLAFGGSMG